MLHLPNHHNSFPHLTPAREVVLSPVPTEDDELIRAIETDHSDPWQLEAGPDATELGEFWGGVERDLKQDPEWFSFTDETE